MSKKVILSSVIYSIKKKSNYLAFIHFPESVRHPQERSGMYHSCSMTVPLRRLPDFIAPAQLQVL